MGARLVAAALMLGTSVFSLPSPSSAEPSQTTLNYRDADIRAFIDDVSMLTGSVFVVDPRVKGKVTVVSHVPVEAGAVMDVFLATLRVNGYTVSAMKSGALKILPSAAGAESAGTSGGANGGDRFVTEVFDLAHVDGGTAATMLKPLVNSEGRIVGTSGSDFVIVVDYASNIDRMRSVLRDIDRDTSVLRHVQLQNTSAGEMKRIVAALEDETGDRRAKSAVQAVAIEGTNTLILRGDKQSVERLAAFAQEIDATNHTRKRGVRVIPLKYAEAEDLEKMLGQVSASIVKADNADAKKGGGYVASSNAKVHIAAHKSTNSLVIHAEADMLEQLSNVIDELDQLREQVLVEAIVVEVSDQAAKELGLQYVLSGSGDSKIPFTATNFSNSAPNILAATGALLAPGNTNDDDYAIVDAVQQAAIDSLLGVSGFIGGIGGQTSDGTIFGVILNALQKDKDSNVLMTPSITTLDNETAKFIVGQEIPVTTGEVLGQNFENPFRTVERQDVGVELEVTPQITHGDGAGGHKLIKLTIRQEASSIFGPVTSNSADLILNKRELETNIMIEDGEIAVLGGLIQDDEQVSVEKVPLLGDIPGLGRLFRSEGKTRNKTNLMVFLRPTIVSTRDARTAVLERQKGAVRSAQEAYGASDASTIDAYMGRVLEGAGQ